MLKKLCIVKVNIVKKIVDASVCVHNGLCVCVCVISDSVSQ